LPGLLRDVGVNTTLVTDERLLWEHPLAVEFDDVAAIDPPLRAGMAPDGRFEQTHLARCFVEIIDRLQGARRPLLLWCHLGSLGTTWDAPWEFRHRYWLEGDPLPSRSADVPDRLLAEDHDPDEVLGFSQAYAGQVSLWDTCLGGFLQALEEHPAAQETLLVLTGARGFPLGEHRRLGPCDEALYAELVQVPLVLRFPERLGAAGRSQALVEPADLWATLLDAWGLAGAARSPTAATLLPWVRQQAATPRDRLLIVGPGAQRAIRTPAWYLRMAQGSELFVKPDDRWEVNNVAVRCLEVVECLEDAATQYAQAIRAGVAADVPPLSRVLLEGLE
jgi:hypothetical protein